MLRNSKKRPTALDGSATRAARGGSRDPVVPRLREPAAPGHARAAPAITPGSEELPRFSPRRESRGVPQLGRSGRPAVNAAAHLGVFAERHAVALGEAGW